MLRGRLQELRIWVPPELYERVLRDAAVRRASLSRCVRDPLELCYEIEADWADALGAVPPAGRAGAAALRHKILDAMEEPLAATLEQHAFCQQGAWIELRRVGRMGTPLAPAGCASTTADHATPRKSWHAGRDSNPRPPGSKPGALSS